MHLPFVTWDHQLLPALATAILVWHWRYPRFLRAEAAGVAGARLRYYAVEIASLWPLAVGVIALWSVTRRPWSALLLGGSPPWRLALGWALAGAFVWLNLAQRRAVLARPARLARILRTLGRIQPLLPRTRGDLAGFAALSLTAGICEELLFRGFVLWYATQWTGPVGGFLISSASFGLMHTYLGLRQVPRTAIIGVLFYVVAMTAGSLLPAMVCHAVTDLVSGDLGYRALAAGDSAPRARPEERGVLRS
jgi:membrane protease YdiL (CAAX protease family)